MLVDAKIALGRNSRQIDKENKVVTTKENETYSYKKRVMQQLTSHNPDIHPDTSLKTYSDIQNQDYLASRLEN